MKVKNAVFETRIPFTTRETLTKYNYRVWEKSDWEDHQDSILQLANRTQMQHDQAAARSGVEARLEHVDGG